MSFSVSSRDNEIVAFTTRRRWQILVSQTMTADCRIYDEQVALCVGLIDQGVCMESGQNSTEQNAHGQNAMHGKKCYQDKMPETMNVKD